MLRNRVIAGIQMYIPVDRKRKRYGGFHRQLVLRGSNSCGGQNRSRDRHNVPFPTSADLVHGLSPFSADFSEFLSTLRKNAFVRPTRTRRPPERKPLKQR